MISVRGLTFLFHKTFVFCGIMFVIGEVVIEEQIAHERFACDVLKCKGACCTLPGGRGAPVEEAEVDEIERAFLVAKKFLSEHHLDLIARKGMIEGTPGNRATTCVDNRECVFVFYEDGIARCSLEKAFINGETTWRKPLSCHLFPIRITSDPKQRLHYEKIPECSSAIDHGHAENIPLYEFLEDSLKRKFGESWYQEFRAECGRRNGSLTE